MGLVRTTVFLALAALAPASVPVQLAGPRQVSSYHELAEIPVGGKGGWDYLTLDETTDRLYLSHGTAFSVVDVKAGKVVGSIADTAGAHGMAIAPGLERGFTTDGLENRVSVVDLKTLKTLSKIDVGEKPDAVIYAEASGRVYVFNGDSKTASVIDPKAAKVVATVELGGSPRFAVEDQKAGRVYNNLEDTSEIVAIDEKMNKVVARWRIAPCEEPSGLAIDVAHHRLFAGCGNGLEVAVDSTSGKVVASWKIGQGVDACRFDPGARARIRVVRRRRRHDRARGRARRVLGRADACDGARCEDDDARPEDAPDLPRDCRARTGARAGARPAASVADDRPGHVQGPGLRATVGGGCSTSRRIHRSFRPDSQAVSPSSYCTIGPLQVRAHRLAVLLIPCFVMLAIFTALAARE